jgi:hypothetical protein
VRQWSQVVAEYQTPETLLRVIDCMNKNALLIDAEIVTRYCCQPRLY